MRRGGIVFSVPALGACGPRATLDASAGPAGQPWALTPVTVILASWQEPQSAGAVRAETQRPQGSHRGEDGRCQKMKGEAGETCEHVNCN